MISATGTWQCPFWPTYPGARVFAGRQLHTVDYRHPGEFAGAAVVVVGGGNSAAQLVAEISAVATTTWVTLKPPRFLDDDVDGRVLFRVASDRAAALAAGRPDPGGVASLGDIVMIPSVRDARDRGALRALPMFDRLTRDGIAWGTRHQHADAILWATGFRPALSHLRPLRCASPMGPSPSPAPGPSKSPACTCWVTATGPGQVRPRSSVSGAPPKPPSPTSNSTSPAECLSRHGAALPS